MPSVLSHIVNTMAVDMITRHGTDYWQKQALVFYEEKYQLHVSSQDTETMHYVNIFLMAQCKTAVTPVQMHWSYCSLALNYLFNVSFKNYFISFKCCHPRTRYRSYHQWYHCHLSLTTEEWLHYILTKFLFHPLKFETMWLFPRIISYKTA